MELTEPMEVEVTPWRENRYYRSPCQARECHYQGTFYRFVTIDGPEFLQLACAEHADQENNFCPHCGHYLSDKQVCPKCHRGKEEQVDAE